MLWEAWAAGLAIVTCPVGSMTRFVKDNENGLLIEPGSVDQLATALDRLFRDEELRASLAQSGIETAQLHTWEQQIGEIHTQLRNLGK